VSPAVLLEDVYEEAEAVLSVKHISDKGNPPEGCTVKQARRSQDLSKAPPPTEEESPPQALNTHLTSSETW